MAGTTRRIQFPWFHLFLMPVFRLRSKTILYNSKFIGLVCRAMLYDTRRNSGTLNSEPIAVDGGHGGPVTYLHMDPYKIVTGSPVDWHFNVLDANTGAPTNSLTCGIENGTNNSTRCCALAVNGSRIVTGSVNDVAEVGCLLFRDFANASCPVFFF